EKYDAAPPKRTEPDERSPLQTEFDEWLPFWRSDI
ncbi:hypothetical protein CDAR_20021, partial [Caerostris darwini]